MTGHQVTASCKLSLVLRDLLGPDRRPAGSNQTQAAISRPVPESSVTLPWSLTW